MFVIALHAPEVAGAVKAGQFVNLGITPGPLLRRPFSVYRADGEQIEVILKAVGAGTSLLLSLAQGERVSCLGPLGQ
jgi:dihydroorotate dehydrogenase electron transfer subunit